MLIDDDGNAILCDFGLSRVRHERTRTLSKSQSGGRIRYTAPELLAGTDLSKTTEQSDVYGLSMTILELATLQPPYSRILNEYQVMKEIQEGIRPEYFSRLGVYSPEDSNRLWLLLECMWHPLPSSRPSASSVEMMIQFVF